MATINTLTDKGREIQKLLECVKLDLDAYHETNRLWHAVNGLHQAVEMMLLNDQSCWEKVDALGITLDEDET